MIKILSKDNSPYGKDFYRDINAAVPAAFRATHEHSCDMNKSGTNSNVNVRTQVPVVFTIDNRAASTNAFSVRTYFTSLQHITSDAERNKAIDEHIKFLILARSDIMAGTLPDTPYDTSATLKSVLTSYAGTL